jgi:hypothetical protein
MSRRLRTRSMTAAQNLGPHGKDGQGFAGVLGRLMGIELGAATPVPVLVTVCCRACSQSKPSCWCGFCWCYDDALCCCRYCACYCCFDCWSLHCCRCSHRDWPRRYHQGSSREHHSSQQRLCYGSCWILPVSLRQCLLQLLAAAAAPAARALTLVGHCQGKVRGGGQDPGKGGRTSSSTYLLQGLGFRAHRSSAGG